MKKILLAFLVSIFSVSFIWAQNAVNQTDAKGMKQGLWEEIAPAGTSKGTYTNNQKEGCWSSYAQDGKLIRIENFTIGLLNGIVVDIDPRGFLVGEAYYENNLLEGTSKKYYYGTNPASIIEYVHGKINGKKKIYYENSAGKIMEESEYKDDIKNGPSNFYTLSGDLIAEYTYVNNQLQGVQKSYYPAKKIMSEQEFVDNMENGFSKEYYENGKLKSEGIFVKGVLNGLWKDYNEDGTLKSQGNYVNGAKEGKWQEFDATGKIIKTTTYSKGQIK